MAGTVISSAVRNNLLALQNTTSMQATLQNRLATGKKVNSALDNPSNFFTASSLNARASGLNSLLDGMSTGIKTLEAADNGMKAITKNIESMQANVRAARSDKSFKGTSFTLDTVNMGSNAQKSIKFSGGAVGETEVSVDAIIADVGGSRSTKSTTLAYTAPAAAAKATYKAAAAYNTGTGATEALVLTFNGTNTNVSLTSADNTVAKAVTTINTAIQADGRTDIEAFDDAGTLSIRTTGNVDGAITVTGTGEGNVFGVQVAADGSDGVHSFTVNNKQVTLTSTENTIGAAVTKANADLGADNTLEAFNDTGKLGFRAKSAGVTTITIADDDTSTAAGLFAATVAGTAPTTAGKVRTVDELATAINENASLKGKVKASNDGGKLRIENISTEELKVVGATATGVNGGTGAANTQTIGGNDVRKNLISQFNDLRTQVDKLSNDASFNGINLLKADKLKITFNEDGTNNVEIQAKSVSGKIRSIDTSDSSLGIGEAKADEFSDDSQLDARLDALSKAVTTLATQSSSFGSALTTIQTRQDFTKSMINTLQGGADSLVNADLNEESATLLALNTRQQLSQTALSLASQADQAVLRLF
jgi:flagellin-like hook-associated protein FlgL